MTSPAANYIGPVFVFHPKVIKFKGLVSPQQEKKSLWGFQVQNEAYFSKTSIPLLANQYQSLLIMR